MRAAEELRYLILAIQREGNRLLGAGLRPLGLTPSQAEVLRVLAERQPLTLNALGQLLVCETTNSPSRLVDRLVAQGLIHRETDPADRRYVSLTLTAAGARLAGQIAHVEDQLYRTIDQQLSGHQVDQTLTGLRALAAAFPAGQAIQRRAQATNPNHTERAGTPVPLH